MTELDRLYAELAALEATEDDTTAEELELLELIDALED
jgi:hypothetical protein